MADLKTVGSAVTPASTQAKTNTTTAEKAVAPAAEKKTVAPAAEKKAAPAKKTAAKKTTTAAAKKTTAAAKKTTEKKTTRKTAAKRGPAKKVEASVYIQFNEMSIASDELTERVKQIWKEKKNKVSDLKDIKVYVNVAESKAYYVVNEDHFGSFDL